MQFPPITQSVEDRREMFLNRVRRLLDDAQRYSRYSGGFATLSAHYHELQVKAIKPLKIMEYKTISDSNLQLARDNRAKADELMTKALELITLLSYETDQFPSQS